MWAHSKGDLQAWHHLVNSFYFPASAGPYICDEIIFFIRGTEVQGRLDGPQLSK